MVLTVIDEVSSQCCVCCLVVSAGMLPFLCVVNSWRASFSTIFLAGLGEEFGVFRHIWLVDLVVKP